MSAIAAPVGTGTGRSGPRRPSRGRIIADRLVFTLIFLVAIAVSLYPLVAMYVNDHNAWVAAKEATVTQREIAEADPVANQRLIQQARAYNETMPKTMLTDPIYGQQAPVSDDYKYYLSMMGGAQRGMGTLTIPAIDSTMPIYHGTDEEVLSKGVGHMYGTDLPVGGQGSHAVLSAHRGLPSLTGFDHLPEMELGDVFFVESLGQKLAYQVKDINTVLPNDLELVHPQVGSDLITLVTCTPYAINTHRLLVTGERIDLEEVSPQLAAAVEEPPFSWSLPPNSWLRLVVAGIAALVLVALMSRWITTDVLIPLARRAGAGRQAGAPVEPVSIPSTQQVITPADPASQLGPTTPTRIWRSTS